MARPTRRPPRASATWATSSTSAPRQEQIYVTQDGGGSGGSNNWINISTGLDGSAVQQIITDPTRGSHDAYAVTNDGVYFIANSIPSASNPTPTWINITGNLKTLAYSIFGQSYNPATDPNVSPYDQAVTLSSIAADWRYAIPNDPTDPSEGYHPVLYVGADSGVFQSLDNGQTWTLFPDTTYGAVMEGGNLPHVSVTSLSLSLGNIGSSTGMPTLDGPYAPNASNQTSAASADPDILMAATYGQGEFAINLAPLIIGNAVTVTRRRPRGPATSSLPVVDRPDHHQRHERDHRLRQRHLDHRRRRDQSGRPGGRRGLQSRRSGPDSEREQLHQ